MPSIREKLAEKKTKLAGPREKMEDHPAALNHFSDGSFYHIPTRDIQANPEQPRQHFDPESLAELTESIREKGVLQPVIVRSGNDGRIFLVAGERRLRAARNAGLETIPAVFTKGNPAEIALIENLQREDLKPVEEAEALARMVAEYGYTHEQLAKVMGKGRTTITETLSLAKLPEAIRSECRRADIYPRRLLVEIAKQPDVHGMIRLFERVKQRNLKSDGLREITRGGGFVGPRRESENRLLVRIDELTRKLEGLRAASWSEEERAGLLRGLRRLRGVIEDILG
jgi:ParB family chromosome partitioning protein